MEAIDSIINGFETLGKITNETIFTGIRDKCESIFKSEKIISTKYTQSSNEVTCMVETPDNTFTITIRDGKYKLPDKKKPKNDEEKKKEAVDMYVNKNLSQTLIGQTLNVSQKTVSNWIKEYEKNNNKK